MQVGDNLGAIEVGGEFPGNPFSCIDCVTRGDSTFCVMGSTNGMVHFVRLKFAFAAVSNAVIAVILVLYNIKRGTHLISRVWSISKWPSHWIY